MPTYNYKSRELIAKIVYYGPGRCGKTSNLQQIHAKMRPDTRSDLLSVATETDRTIYFDLLPLNLGTISGMKFMVRLFTVPGQIYYAETRKLVLKGADGIVFVADSQNHMMDENRQSLQDLKQNLAANGIDYNTIPMVMQWNKRDLPHLISEAELDATLNDRGVQTLGAVASQGEGALETLRLITLGVFNHIKASGKAGTVPQTGNLPKSPTMPLPSPAPATIPMVGASRSSFPQPSMPMPPPSAGGSTAGGVGGAARANGMPQPPTSPPGPAARPAGPGMNHQVSGTGSLRPSAPPMGGGSFGLPRPPPPPPAPQVGLPPPSPMGVSGPEPARIGSELILQEFKNLAVMHSQMAERITALEHKLARLGRENQEIRELLTQQTRS
jgi:mutual gliding-motility protein MglA